jgi:hypothetical protein
LKLGKKRMRGRRELDNLLPSLRVRDSLLPNNRDRDSKEVTGEEGQNEVDQELEGEGEEGVEGDEVVLSRVDRLLRRHKAERETGE